MRIEIINTGAELMLGRVLNTHQQWLCRQLADAGYPVSRQTAVGDQVGEIRQALRDALGRADLVITTGGLGPTTDDLTCSAVAELLNLPLRENPIVWADIQRWFAARNRPVPESARVQSLVPEGALVLRNAHGTAPGLVVEVPCTKPDADRPAGGSPGRPPRRPKLVVMLPGPPRELQPMFTGQVLPLVQKLLPLDKSLACRTLRTTGLSESLAQERSAGLLAPLAAGGLEVGYCARPGEVDICLAASGAGAEGLLKQAETVLRAALGEFIYGVGEDSLEAVVVRLLRTRRRTVVVAESCTGGRLASRITDVPGASEVFLGGLVTYSNRLKQRLLGVRAGTLATHGAVSEATAREMAQGARARYQADYGVAITGIAGPGGGSEDKPVGTVFIALATEAGIKVARQFNPFDRETFKHVTSQQALELLRRELV